MPRVQVPTGNMVEAQPLPSTRFRAPDNGGGVLGALGQGAQQLAQAGSQYAEVQQHIENQKVQAEARDIDNMLVTKIGALRANYQQQTGLNAVNARPQFDKDILALEQETLRDAGPARGQLRNTIAPRLAQRIAGLRAEMDVHAAAQTVAANKQASISRMQLAGEEAVATTDPIVRQEAIVHGLQEIASQARQDGLPAEWVESEGLRFESGVHRRVVEQLQDTDRVDDAIAYRDRYKDRITGADEAAITASLKVPLQRREANGDANGVMGRATAGDSPAPYAYTDPLHGMGREPVPGGRFNAHRDYGGHQGIDIPAREGTPVFPSAGGIARVSRSELGGNIVAVDHGDGRVTRYMHLGAVAVKDGERVGPDTQIGGVGMTGRTSGPHLHYEVRENGRLIDPGKAIASVQQSPQRHDLNALLAGADKAAAANGWSPERLDRAKDEISRRVGRDEQLLKRNEDEAGRKALEVINGLGDNGFTSLSQIPASIRAGLSVDDQHRLIEMASNNAKARATGTSVKANGGEAFNLNMMAIYQPDEFKKMNLGMVQDKVTASELEGFARLQAKMRTAAPVTTDHSRIWGQINRIAPDLGLDLGASKGKPNKPQDRARAMQLFSTVQADLNAQMDGKRQPTDDEVKRSIDRAVRMVVRDGNRDNPVMAFEVGGPAASVPAVVRDRIVSTWRARYRSQPSEGQIASEYQRYRGQEGFWK